MGGPTGEIDPKEAVLRMVKVADANGMDSTGAFLHREGHVIPF
jgi:hypothetical protein